MATEEKDPIENSNSNSSPQPKGEGEDASSPTDVSGGKEDKTLEELSEKYSQSSTEAKRLKEKTKELESKIAELEEYGVERESYIESLESLIEEEKEAKVKTEEEEKAKIPLRETFALNEEKQRKIVREEIEREKKEEQEANRRYEEALKANPRLKNKGYAKLVAAKMKSLDTGDIEKAAKEVDKDLAKIKEEEMEEEPFVEGGKGKSSPQPEISVEDEIRQSLKRSMPSSGLQGLV